MIFSKSITFDEEDLRQAVTAAPVVSVRQADSGLIENLRERDAAAFDALINRYSGDVYALLYRLTSDPDEAADLTQETFLHALRAIKSFRGESGLKTWLFRIAINESRNRFRWWKRRRRDQTLSLDATIGDSETQVWETISDNSISPEDEVLRQERTKALNDALGMLKTVYREAIVLCDLEGFSYEECAEALGTNIGTVKSRISRGREELRRQLKGF
ncbi:MAG: sigma-70 family RNA polymerase sigma factor [Acidobacteria bacterium]|nr:sigma-70 family RNA polymerase sigma factor [Acidobacteriota bacterium]